MVSLDFNYLDQLINYGSAIENAQSDIKSIKGYKELKEKVASHYKTVEKLRLEYNLCTEKIKESFELDKKGISEKVNRLINSKVVFNRESRLDGYKQLTKDYIKIEAKIKCLN